MNTPLNHNFIYIVKLRFTRVYLFFLFLIQNMDCGYLLEPLRQDGSNVYPNLCFEQKQEKHKKVSTEKFQFLQLFVAWASFRNAQNRSVVFDTPIHNVTIW